MEIYLIRHTTPKIAKAICYGQSDIGLDASFHKELKFVLQHLPQQLDEVYSSPLSRCTLLAREIFASVKTDHNLMEMNFGNWEMKPWDELPKNQLSEWMDDFVNVTVPGGESFKDLLRRSQHFLQSISGKENKRIGVVCHAGVIRAMVGHFLHVDPRYLFRIQIDYGSVSLVRVNNGLASVEFINRR